MAFWAEAQEREMRTGTTEVLQPPPPMATVAVASAPAVAPVAGVTTVAVASAYGMRGRCG